MKGRIIPILLALAVLLALSVGRGAAQGPATQGAGQPQTQLGSAFTYQGELKKDGAPVNDTCSMAFSLYDAPSAGNLVGGPTTTSVTVADGLFTVALDFGSGVFTGDARWLEIAVQCPGDPVFATLDPRQALTAAPYALSLRPGANVIGELAGDTVLFAYNTTTSGESYGLYGRSNSTAGYGVFGRAGATTGITYGTYGRSDSTQGRGVQGAATAASGYTVGVEGVSASTDGYGVYGLATATSGGATGVSARSYSTAGYGVWAWASATSGTTYGVYGRASSTDGTGVYGYAMAGSGYTHGVYGLSESPNGVGVLGDNSSGTGVYGHTTGGIGVYGYADGVHGVAIRAEGQTGGNLIEAWHGPLLLDRKFYVADNGNVYADGQYLNPASGYAEMLPGAAGLEAGDVLVVGPEGTLTRCTAAFQPTVVGVYAPQAGYVGGAVEGMAGEVPVAVVGVVRVKVSAENGPITPGDLLVAAATPGHAMRAGADPALGTVIGKALGSLDKDTGTLLMLVMLR